MAGRHQLRTALRVFLLPHNRHKRHRLYVAKANGGQQAHDDVLEVMRRLYANRDRLDERRRYFHKLHQMHTLTNFMLEERAKQRPDKVNLKRLVAQHDEIYDQVLQFEQSVLKSEPHPKDQAAMKRYEASLTQEAIDPSITASETTPDIPAQYAQ